MKTISDYTIYCTEAQTKKALELGAPVVLSEKRDVYNDYPQEIPGKIGKYFTFEESYSCCFCNDYGAYIIPTAEQMIGWLRKEKGLFVESYLNGECCYSFSPIVSTKEDGEIIHLEAEDDPDKATLTAIDAALEYLIDNDLIK